MSTRQRGRGTDHQTARWQALACGCVATLLCALGPLTARAAGILERVTTEKVLSVCTSGDYAPFSLKQPDGSYAGADIDMARALASSLGAQARFVETPWRDLLTRIGEGACDIAMGGISVSLERQRLASFSQPYLSDGKSAIARCSDAARFDRLSAIDVPGVRVIVNPGGTNQRFVDAHIKAAGIIVFPDNTRIFDEIAQGRADVMITDVSEIKLQVARHTNLCMVSAKAPFLFGEKAYLMPQNDFAWHDYVNQWLHLQLNNGAYAEIAQRWMP